MKMEMESERGPKIQKKERKKWTKEIIMHEGINEKPQAQI